MSLTGVEKLRRDSPRVRYFDAVLLGYARVSTPDQNPDHQVDALRRAGVGEKDI
jgi:hypothetical protein